MQIIDCKKARSEILETANNVLSHVKEQKNNPDFKPTLAVLQVEGDDASSVYVRNKKKACEACGINFMHLKFPNDVEYSNLKTVLTTLAKDSEITGILLQLPLPAHLKEYESDLLNTIPWQKDIDGLTTASIGRLWSGMECLHPCTAEGIMSLLPDDLSGKNVLVINRSMLIGKPLVALLQSRNATVTLAHSKTDMEKLIWNDHDLIDGVYLPDIIITAVGQNGFISSDMSNNFAPWLWEAKEDYMIIDASITRNDEGKLCGDVDLTNTQTKAQITPVPGGVGILTTAMVAYNVAYAANLQERYPL